jgi:hypothetical protein
MFDLFFAAWPVRTSCEKMVLFLLPVLFVHTFTGVHTKNTLSCFDLTGQNREEREQIKNFKGKTKTTKRVIDMRSSVKVT